MDWFRKESEFHQAQSLGLQEQGLDQCLEATMHQLGHQGWAEEPSRSSLYSCLWLGMKGHI